MAVFSETITLKDEVTPAAKRMASAFNDLSKGLEAAQKNMIKASAAGDQGAFDKAAAQASKFEKGLGNLDPALVSQGKSAEIAGKQTAAMGEDMAATVGILEGMALAAVAVVAALGAIVFAGAKLAIEANEAKEKLRTLFDALGEGKITGEKTIAMIDDLGDRLGLTRDQLAPFTKGFMVLGINGVDALRELTVAAAGLDQITAGAGEAFTKLFGKVDAAAQAGQKLTIPFPKLVTSLKAANLNVGDLASAMKMTEGDLAKGLKAGTVNAKDFANALTDAATTKGAGPLARAGMQLGNVWKKATESVSKFFEDVDVGPFLKEVKSMFDILGQANPSGRALKSGIGAFFKEVFVIAAKVVPMIKHFLLDVIIYGLKAYIAIKPMIQAFKDWAASADGASTISSVLDAVVTAFKVMGAVVLFVVGVATIFFGALLGIQVAIVGVGYAIMSFVGGAAAALAGWVAGAASAAADFISGLVGGIAVGGAKVVGAVSGLAKSALNAFTGKDGIDAHSPSVKMMKAGGHMTDGVVEGIGAGTPDVHGASSGMAQAGVDGATAAAKSRAGASGGGSTTINVSVQIDGAGKSALELTQEMVSQVFERVALSAGV